MYDTVPCYAMIFLSYLFLDAPERHLNAPIAVQMAARTLEDEALLGMGEVVDGAIKKYLAKSKQSGHRPYLAHL
jgi:hypothetical protein